MTTLLQVTDFHIHFDTPGGTVRANNGVTLEVRQGESLGIMGESGCGKTVLFLGLLRLQQPGRIVRGRVLFDGRDITSLSEPDMQRIRGRDIALVPQNQATALNPAYTVRQQLQEALDVWRGGRRCERASADVDDFIRVFSSLGFEAGPVLTRLLQSYPHQLSGGMRQRVLIAMALLSRAKLLIADEPTTALDQAVKMQSLAALQRLRGSVTMLVISHDVQTIAATCDRVAIMYGGRIIESGQRDEVLLQPRHPYTRLLLAAQRRTRGKPLPNVVAETLNLIDFPPGCPFHPSCPEALGKCSTIAPPERATRGAMVTCHRYGGDAA